MEPLVSIVIPVYKQKDYFSYNKCDDILFEILSYYENINWEWDLVEVF